MCVLTNKEDKTMIMTATMYGVKMAAWDKVTGRAILATVKDIRKTFCDWEIDKIEQDKIAPVNIIESMERAAIKQGSRQIEII